MLNCARPEIFPLRSGCHLWLSVNGGITIWTEVFSVCWGQWPPRSQSTYQSVYQIILLCEKVGYKPVLSIFGITNYEHLDMHIYLLLGCTEMHKTVKHIQPYYHDGGGEHCERKLFYGLWSVHIVFEVPPLLAPKGHILLSESGKITNKFPIETKNWVT